MTWRENDLLLKRENLLQGSFFTFIYTPFASFAQEIKPWIKANAKLLYK